MTRSNGAPKAPSRAKHDAERWCARDRPRGSGSNRNVDRPDDRGDLVESTERSAGAGVLRVWSSHHDLVPALKVTHGVGQCVEPGSVDSVVIRHQDPHQRILTRVSYPFRSGPDSGDRGALAACRKVPSDRVCSISLLNQWYVVANGRSVTSSSRAEQYQLGSRRSLASLRSVVDSPT